MKKRIILSFLSVFLIIGILSAQKTITIEKTPSTIEDFIKLRNKKATTPEGGAAMFCLAMKIYMDNKELGEKCFIAIADKSELKKGNTYKEHTLLSWMTIRSSSERYPLIANCYIDGATPENGYEIKLPYKYKFKTGKYSGDASSGKIKIFVVCSGADSDRPIHMIKNDKGIWKASKWSSLYAGMKPVTKKEVDDI